MSIFRLEPQKCLGCSACVAICGHDAIYMAADDEGFAHPVVVAERCTECGLCEKICPALNATSTSKDDSQHIYAAYSKDSEVVGRSTSGGVFYHLAEAVIQRGGAVYGAVYDKDFHVIHTCATDLSGVRAMHGAKYVQSHVAADIYHDIRMRLQSGQWILFSGTPCQTDAVRSFLRKDYERLILCDLVCRSVSSPMIYNDYLSFAQRKKHLKSINMRWKGNGWADTKFQLAYSDGSEMTGKGMAQLWHDIHFSGLVTRPSCHQCPYTSMQRAGDITLGDFWGIRKSHGSFYNHQGVSLIMTNTAKGTGLFREISHHLNTLPVTAKECSQPALRTPVAAHPKRADFWRDYPQTSFYTLSKKYFRYGWLNQEIYRLRRKISTLLRLSTTH